MTCTRFYWASTLAIALASLSAAGSSGCGSAKRDGLYSALAGAGGAAGASGVAGEGGSSAGSGSTAGGGGSVAGGAGGLGNAGAAGNAGGQGGAGAGGAAGAGVQPELDAGADASFPDASAARRLSCAPTDQANCDVLGAVLAHRYSFSGSGSSVLDRVGTAHGTIVNGQLSGAGSVVLSGAQAPENYVNLPNGIVSTLGSATFEAWLSWGGGEPWQRVFDFGSSVAAEDDRAGGDAYLFLTPRSDTDTVRVSFISSETVSEVQVNSSAPLASGVVSHLAVVVDAQAGSLALFVNGAPVGSIALPSSLAALASDDNNWLGRSEFPTDPGFAGSLHELRIYSAALSPAQLALSFQLGPDAPVSE